MGLFRIQHTNYEQIFKMSDFDTEITYEWEDAGRVEEDVWIKRYEYEASLLCEVIESHGNVNRILELGSGPGILSQKILKEYPDIEYHLVDKPFAKKYFEDNNFKGTFFVKDLSSDFDTSGLLDCYDIVITNDFLEHIYNPHIIIKKIYELTDENSIYFISNPNWRMSHQYIYRGLFDFDNFVYLLYTHLWELQGFYGSFLKTPPYPRISSETLLPDDNLTDWNHYMLFKHRDLTDKE